MSSQMVSGNLYKVLSFKMLNSIIHTLFLNPLKIVHIYIYKYERILNGGKGSLLDWLSVCIWVSDTLNSGLERESVKVTTHKMSNLVMFLMYMVYSDLSCIPKLCITILYIVCNDKYLEKIVQTLLILWSCMSPKLLRFAPNYMQTTTYLM